MGKLILDSELRSKLNGLTELMEIRDESDRPVGYFLPAEQYKQLLLASVRIPLSQEEIERRRKENGGSSLEEFWRRMGVQ